MSRYHLRYQVMPDQDPTALADFCVKHSVDEVVLIIGSEELYAGHLAGVEEDRWYAATRAAREVLADRGIGVSLNPWVTSGHADRGRVQDLGFAPLVSPTGEVSTAAASFACPVWRAWIAAHYGRFAELGFRVMWLEDDFRFHNHSPLTWGGGFEPEMLARLGLNVTREELVAAVTAPGEPHPWRALLQRTWRTAQLEVVDLVREAIAGRSALGLMSSGLGIASVEGRDWNQLFERIGAHRPHFAPYGDSPASGLARSVAMLELQNGLRPPSVEVAPEIENWPHTEWTKSDTQTWSEMVTATLSGADALLLDVFPFVTGDPARYPRIGRMLANSRATLDFCATDRARSVGVGIPWQKDTAAYIHGDGTMQGLESDPLRASEYLLPYGVPIRAGVAEVNALFGTVAWGVPDASVEQLLLGGLLLDGTAAAILDRRGFGELLGVTLHGEVARETASPAPYSMERILDGGALLSVNVQPSVARMTAVPGAETWTEILTPRGEPWGAGRVAYVNSLGGRVVTMGACRPETLGRCDDGRRLAHRALRFLGAHMPFVTGGPHLIPQYARLGPRHRLAVANGSADPARPRVTVEDVTGDITATLLSPLSTPRPVEAVREDHVVTIEDEVPHRGYLVLEWS
ncbi:hypothetical protein [Streptomyces sp. NPDC026092]|uniref:hypothetical protein n=1 Tax=Streptomyces sp. NPDC026092 TaxID=3154797 RepID=UPI0033CB1E83